MTRRTLVNGRENQGVDPGDRGLQYGDGLFETMAVVAGQLRRLDSHMERLQSGCARLGILCPERALLETELIGLAREQARAVLKLIVTRGPGARGYQSDESAQTTRIMSLHPWPLHPQEWWEEGVTVRFCDTRLGVNPALAGLKHLNRLEQVLARREWSDAAIAEGLMLDAAGSVVCGTMSNVFAVHDSTLLTPPVDRCGVAGTTRKAVLQIAADWGIRTREQALTPADLARADEVFLTNAVIGVWPVRKLADQPRAAGPIARRLQSELR